MKTIGSFKQYMSEEHQARVYTQHTKDNRVIVRIVGKESNKVCGTITVHLNKPTKDRMTFSDTKTLDVYNKFKKTRKYDKAS